jgi:hypothetical protein
MSSVIAPAPGQPDEAIASILGEAPLHGSQRNTVMASHVCQ